MLYSQVVKELTSQQSKELLIKSFGEQNSRYHTLDEIPLYKLIEIIPKTKCPYCGKEFILNIEGGGEVENNWFCLDCFWNIDREELVTRVTGAVGSRVLPECEAGKTETPRNLTQSLCVDKTKEK